MFLKYRFACGIRIFVLIPIEQYEILIILSFDFHSWFETKQTMKPRNGYKYFISRTT